MSGIFLLFWLAFWTLADRFIASKCNDVGSISHALTQSKFMS